MKQTLIVFVLIVAASCAALGQGANKAKKNQKSAEEEVLTVISILADAGKNNDVKTVERYYADGFLHTNADGSLMTKADVLAHYRSPSGVVVEVNDRDENKVKVYGDSAFVNTRVTYKGRMNDQPFSWLFRVTYMLTKLQGRWQVIASHASIIPQK
jgi:ketosteroid isomerase-like protein